ncbi:MAG: DUF6010 family protein [Saprospiraceae bacterium]|nr:DUF6010 family protein [Saprospiraceae bacterium]
MNAVLIGLSSSLITILIFTFLKRVDKNTVYGLILMGIGFLYIGYTWTEINTAMLSGLQALFFMSLAYFGIKKNYWFLVAGYFLHGIWDFLYPLFANSDLLPPNYDYFCFTYDVIVGIYLLVVNFQTKQTKRK